MNHLLRHDTLRNRFFAMRHGESEANARDLIVSAPAAGVADYGLSERGREQAAAALAGCPLAGADTLIVSSDFKRALETAHIVHALLGCRSPVVPRQTLRERFFGEWEKTSARNYERVWQADRRDADHAEHGVEPANAVMDRATRTVTELDAAHAGRTVLLVAHGDVLQILQCAFHALPATRHRDVAHLATAEIRELLLSASAVNAEHQRA